MTLSRERIANDGSHRKIDYISLVEVLQNLSSMELNKLIRDFQHSIMQLRTANGSSEQLGMKDFAMLPRHLMARLLEADCDQAFFRYLLAGLTVLHTMYSIAPYHTTLKKMLLDDIYVLRQSVDLIFYIPTVLKKLTEGNQNQSSSAAICLHSTIVAGSLYLLKECISPEWEEVANFLSIHPKADNFMEAVFIAVYVDLELLQKIVSDQVGGSPEMTHHHCQQCEASLQCIYTLCRQKPLEDYLVKHKVSYGTDGILLLVQCVLNLNIPISVEQLNYVSAAVYRMKSKVLSILLYLCNLDSISYLDEVAKAPGRLKMANTVALQVIELLSTLFRGCYIEQILFLDKNMPKGGLDLQLNAMRIADVLTDDTNFRAYITIHITDDLATLFLLPHEEFVSIWCVPDLGLWEADATLEYDPSVAARWVLNSLSDLPVAGSSKLTYTPSTLPRGSYTYQRTSLLVKLIGNLHCFAPDICTDEEDMFLKSLFSCLRKKILEQSDRASGKAYNVSKNICSLLIQAESLMLNEYVCEKDVQILRMFVIELNKLISTADML